MSEYKERDSILLVMGFPSYQAYLASKLWKGIRLRAMERSGRKCVVCKDPATEVHHTEYSRLTLEGKVIKTLKPLCRICHEILHREEWGGLDANRFIPAGPMGKRERQRLRRMEKDKNNGTSSKDLRLPNDPASIDPERNPMNSMQTGFFPIPASIKKQMEKKETQKLVDHFAGIVLSAILMKEGFRSDATMQVLAGNDPVMDAQVFSPIDAQRAYIYAEAMMDERSRRMK